jgi:ribosomal protein L18E
MKKELHIKRSIDNLGFVVSYKDNKVWRALSPVLSHDEAIKAAIKVIKFYPDGYLKQICDCQTDIN